MQEPQDLSPQSSSHQHDHHHQESESPNPSTFTDQKPLHSPVPPSNVIGVFGLSNRTNERGLEEVFGAFGQIQRINLIKDRATGESRGYGFIYYETVSEAEAAKEKTNAMNLDGREIRVDFSKTSGPHSSTPGQYLGKHRLDRGRYSSDSRRYSSSGKRSYSPEDSDRGSRHHHRYRSRSPSSRRDDYHRHESGRRNYSPRSGNASSSRREYSPERSFSRRSRSPASSFSSSSSRRNRSPIRNYSPNRSSRRNYQSSPIGDRRNSEEPRNFDSPSEEGSHHHQ